MLGPLDYFLWMVGFALELYVVVRAILCKDFFRYFTLNFYMLAVAVTTVGQVIVVHRYGYTSHIYAYFYYYSDTLLTVFLYFAILGLYQHVFQEMQVSQHIRAASVLLLGATCWFSYLVVNQHKDYMIHHFVIELSQNLYFIGVLLSILLWVAAMKLRETRLRLIQLVLSMGIFFSSFAAAYALRNLYPELSTFLQFVMPLLGLWLPLAWAYTFSRVPEEARLATSRLATTVR